MKSTLLSVLTVIALPGRASCDHRPPGEAVRSAKQRVTSPDVAVPDLKDLVNGNTAYTFDQGIEK
jgi:hypothetical protein